MSDPRPWWLLADPVRPGYWVVRFLVAKRRWGPHCPACIIRLQTWHEPGLAENLMERSPFFAAFVSGEPVGIWDIQASTHTTGRICRVEREITRGEYERLMLPIYAARRADRYLPAALPFQPVRVDQVEIPFLGGNR